MGWAKNWFHKTTDKVVMLVKFNKTFNVLSQFQISTQLEDLIKIAKD